MIVRSFPYAGVPENFWMTNLMNWLVDNVGQYREYNSYSGSVGAALSESIQKWEAMCNEWIEKANLNVHRNDICMICELTGDGWCINQIDELLVRKGAWTKRHIVIELDDPDKEFLMRLSI